jgi:protoheme IX farnesyltransferase
MNGNKLIYTQKAIPEHGYVFKHYLEMFKSHLCLYIGLSAVFGHVMAQQRFSADSLLTGILVFLLATGSAILNNIQDREYDCFFARTRNRTLPQNKVPLTHAKALFIVFIISGLSGLFITGGFVPFFWGIMAIVCYNGLYTPLKKLSLLAIIPGSLSGILPPLIGWTWAGKSIFNPDILIIMNIFALWQIPHFFIILLRSKNRQLKNSQKTMFNPDKNPYLKNFPCFTKIFSPAEIMLQIMIWTSLYSLGIVLFLINGLITNQILLTISGLNGFIITFLIPFFVVKNDTPKISFAFASINLSMLLFMATGIIDKCF